MADRTQQQPEALAELVHFSSAPLAMHRGSIDSLVAHPVEEPKIEAQSLRYVGTHAFTVGQVVDGVAVIPIIGPLAKRSYYRWTYDDFAVSIQRALDDPKIGGIMLNIDSPGGMSAGMPDLADMIFEARGQKPIHAIANESAYSAAYGIASACDVVWLPRTGGVGSVGTVAIHVDYSQWNESRGYKVTPIFAGEKKIDGHPDFPLSESAYRDLESEINRVNDLFVSLVARNRGISEDDVRATEAGTFHGDRAIEAQFADRVGTFDEAMVSLQSVVDAQPSSFLSSIATAVGMSTEQLQSDLESAGFKMIETERGDAPTQEAEQMAETTETKTENQPSAEASKPEPNTTVEQPTPAAAAESEKVVDINTARSEGQAAAAAEFKANAAQINQICTLAGCPEKAGAFIESGKSPSEVSEELINAKAENAGPEISPHTAGGANGDQAEPTIDIGSVYTNWNAERGIGQSA